MEREQNDLEDGEIEDGECEDTQQSCHRPVSYVREPYCVHSRVSSNPNLHGMSRSDEKKIGSEACIGKGRGTTGNTERLKLFEKGERRGHVRIRSEGKSESSAKYNSQVCKKSHKRPSTVGYCPKVLKETQRRDVGMKRSYAHRTLSVNMWFLGTPSTCKKEPNIFEGRCSSDMDCSRIDKEGYKEIEMVQKDGHSPLCDQKSIITTVQLCNKNASESLGNGRSGEERSFERRSPEVIIERRQKQRHVKRLLSCSGSLETSGISESSEKRTNLCTYDKATNELIDNRNRSRIIKRREQRSNDMIRSHRNALPSDLHIVDVSQISEKENNADAYNENGKLYTNERDYSSVIEKEEKRGQIRNDIKNASMDFKRTTNKDNRNGPCGSVRESIGYVNEMRKVENSEAIDHTVDDEWIFESLGEIRNEAKMERRSEEAMVADMDALRIELEKERMKLADDRKRMEEDFVRGKKQLAANLYTLLVTARQQINQLNAEKESLMAKLEANSTLKCPSCDHLFSLSKNCIKPKYVHVLKGRNTIELLFENLEALKRWLHLNNLERDEHGVPVLLETRSNVATLSSTNSLILAANRPQNAPQRKDVSSSMRISSADSETRLGNTGNSRNSSSFYERRSSFTNELRKHCRSQTRPLERLERQVNTANDRDECEFVKRGTCSVRSDGDETTLMKCERTTHRIHTNNTEQNSIKTPRKRPHSPLKYRKDDQVQPEPRKFLKCATGESEGAQNERRTEYSHHFQTGDRGSENVQCRPSPYRDLRESRRRDTREYHGNRRQP